MKKKLILLLFICLMAGNSYGQYSECLTGYPAILETKKIKIYIEKLTKRKSLSEVKNART